MNDEDMTEFVKNLSPLDAIEIIGLTPAMIAAVKAKLAPLNEYESNCYKRHFKGNRSIKTVD